ncbi:hypothetical protein LBMAG44_12530 [Gemmatimonadota bacterium]|nr:hypothetical protein LBMAG44_12530 [Gemmatimonadota bacterium]
MAVLEGGFVEGDRMQAIVDGDLLKFEKAQGGYCVRTRIRSTSVESAAPEVVTFTPPVVLAPTRKRR